jgi:hypothetical protein
LLHFCSFVPHGRIRLASDALSILSREPDLIKPFELAQLGNILPDTAEMAKSLIPSYVLDLCSPRDAVP